MDTKQTSLKSLSLMCNSYHNNRAVWNLKAAIHKLKRKKKRSSKIFFSFVCKQKLSMFTTVFRYEKATQYSINFEWNVSTRTDMLCSRACLCACIVECFSHFFAVNINDLLNGFSLSIAQSLLTHIVLEKYVLKFITYILAFIW